MRRTDATVAALIGFAVMMVPDVALGRRSGGSEPG
jgi:hypothetical protein